MSKAPIAGALRNFTLHPRCTAKQIADSRTDRDARLQLITRDGVAIYKYSGSPEDWRVARSFGFAQGRCYLWTKDPRVARKLLAHATDECAAAILLALLN